MDAEDIDDLITNYSEFEKKIDDKIQAYQKLKDSPEQHCDCHPDSVSGIPEKIK